MTADTTMPPLAEATAEDVYRKAILDAAAASDTSRLRSATRRYLAAAASPLRAAKFIIRAVRGTPPEGLMPFRLALLSSFSIEMLHDPLVAYGYTEGLEIEVFNPGYDQYHQQIIAPDSSLYAANPDAIVLAVDGSRLAPELYDNFLSEGRKAGTDLIARIVARITELVTTLRRHSAAPLFLHTLGYPRHACLGILDATMATGQRAMIAQVNQQLSTLSQRFGAVFLIDIDALSQALGQERWHDRRLEFFARSPIARSAFDPLARYYMRFIRALAGNSRKCLIVDLDNTLWGGIVGEDGPDGIALGSEYPGNAFVDFQRALLMLRDRGVVLAIASKNNPADVAEAFSKNSSMLMTLDDFSAREIHWEPKSVSISRIARALNLGLRHMVFVDDNAVECAEVSYALPEVTVIQLPPQPEKMVDVLLSEGLFDTLLFSDEDAQRSSLYQQRAAAEQMRHEMTSVEEYYRTLEMQVELTPLRSDSIPRASQMTRKTTQFNTTTALHSEAALDRFRHSKDYITLTMRVIDKFGDNGIVGFALGRCEGTRCTIESFLMSCRVINRGVETAMLHRLVDEARAKGAEILDGWILPTARNAPVRDLFERHGFSVAETREDGSKWYLDLTRQSVAMPDWLKVNANVEP